MMTVVLVFVCWIGSPFVRGEWKNRAGHGALYARRFCNEGADSGGRAWEIGPHK